MHHKLLIFISLLSFSSTLSAQTPASDFTYMNFFGDSTSLSDFKGKVVYIDVWASWCHFCRKAIPDVKRIHRLFKREKDIVFLNVSIDEKEQGWRFVISKNKLGGTHVITKQGFRSKIIKDYNIKGIPYYLLIDKEGNLVADNTVRPEDFDIIAKLEKMLEE